MASQYVRLMDTRVVTPSAVGTNVADLGAFETIVLDPRILVTGGGQLYIETSAVNEEGGWRIVHTIELNATSNLVTISNFLRYVRWRAHSNVTGTPTVLLDLVAKGG